MIVGLTDRTPSFKEIGRLRLGAPKSQGLKEIPHFRPDFRPDALDAQAIFMQVYCQNGVFPTQVNIRLPFPEIIRCWDAFYEVYNTSGMLGMADGERWLYLRHNKTGELLVKDGVPTNARDLPVDGNGLPYMPFDKAMPVYSYTAQSGKMKGQEVAVFARPTGRLKFLVPELKRAAYVMMITHSLYNIMKISEQLAGIDVIARNAGMSLPLVPMALSRRKELISVSINGRKAMQEHYLVNVEIDPLWMEAQFRFLDTLMPGVAAATLLPGRTITPALQLPAGDFTPEDFSEGDGGSDDAPGLEGHPLPENAAAPAVPESPAEPDTPFWCEWCGERPSVPDVPCEACRQLGATPESKPARLTPPPPIPESPMPPAPEPPPAGSAQSGNNGSANGNGARPYAPAAVKEKLSAAAQTIAESGRTCSDKQRNLLRVLLEQCFAGESDSDEKRKAVSFYLTGKAGSKEIPDGFVIAMIDKWLAPTADSGGAYQVNAYATQEAHAIVQAARVGEGQQQLF